VTPSLPFSLPGFEIMEVQSDGKHIDVTAVSTAVSGCCPDCHSASTSIHSTYQRHPRDLPVQEKTFRMHLLVNRFFCPNPACPRKTFTEAISQVAAKHAHRTLGFTKRLAHLGLALGGRAGARLGKQTGIPTSRSTLLRVLRRLRLPEPPTPRVMGIDDWAWRKRKSYGTILVDHEQGHVVELLPDRESGTVVEWLKAHPGVEIVTRDRSASYGEAISQGAPQAQQVADRWHLLKNLRDTVEEVLSAHRKCLALQNPPVSAEAEHVPTNSLPSVPASNSKEAKAQRERRQQRLARYQTVVDLHRKGVSQTDIADKVGLSLKTVSTWLATGEFPERKPIPVGSKSLRPYLEYIHRRWDEGCHNAAQLWREICQMGYNRGPHSIQDYCARLRQGLVLQSHERTAVKPAIRRYSPKEAAYLLTSWPERLSEQQIQDLGQMRQAHSAIEQAYTLAQDFLKVLAAAKPDNLNSWMREALTSKLTPFETFATGLHRDLAAVKAALELHWSNGRTEGHVNRLKLIKRQMYGRAGFDLLRIRVIYPP
jgi:transposase